MKNILSTFLFLIFIVTAATAQLPFKNDSLYKTIFAKDFCKMIQKNPQLVLLDVRSPGEYSDTSQFASLNLGRLKGAVNIEIGTIRKNIHMMDKYKDKTLIIYCSHSQRSRRVSKLLSENGFTSFYNLNGGMSSINQLTEAEFPCRESYTESNLSYTNLSVSDVADLISKEKNLVVIDVRPAMQFENKDTVEENNTGRIKGAVNIPYDQLKQKTEVLKQKYQDKPLLIYTATGDGDAARAATELTARGFKKVYHLLGGIQSFIASRKNLSVIENPPPYNLLDVVHTLALLKATPGLVIYDTRTKNEFENKDEKEWINLGNMKNAVHIQLESFEKLQLPADKNSLVLIYGHEEASKLAKMLTSKGYKNVNVLEGFYDFVWSGFNVESCRGAKDFIVNHQGLY
ncbi:MAG: rhodanese-like domain-containing protein [Bacteroidia bacterium]